MAYCPECLTEYEPWSRDCVDCHVPLRAGSPPASSIDTKNSEDQKDLDLVVLRTFTGTAASLNAELARNILDAEGIPSMLLGDNMARIVPLHASVLLEVERRNAAQAKELLDDYFDNLTDSPPKAADADE